MTMEEMLSRMELLFTSIIGWVSNVVEMFFENPVTFILFAIPIASFIIFTVISILKSLFK